MEHHLNVHLIRSKKRRKTLSLRIKEDGRIVLYVPYHTPKGEIEGFIKEKESWVIKKISEKERSIKETEKAFIPGEKFLYLGESYPLEIRESDHQGPPLKLSFGKFILDLDHIEKARDLFILWYKREAKEIIAGRVDYYSNRLHLFPKEIRITSAKSRWGSCSRDNRLSFSWRMVMAPLTVIDYILIHELAHIKEKNHSGRFWSYLESILPDYRRQRLWLKENGRRLRF
ncbi:MAG: M48 family metallopeptidase [Deltaproteobacteria bacterium]|nr:M48 family metallopeptidase [Deltaproteobacteria bacterium]